MRMMLFVPWPDGLPFCPGHVASHSPTQKSNCFCCAAMQGFGGAWVLDCAKTAAVENDDSSKRVSTQESLVM